MWTSWYGTCLYVGTRNTLLGSTEYLKNTVLGPTAHTINTVLGSTKLW